MDEGEEFLPRLLCTECPEHRGRHRCRVLLLDAAHHHAQVPRFHHHADAQRLGGFLNRLGNLYRQPLLHLQAPREDFHQPRHFAQADHLALRNVRDVYLAEERQHVVLAQAEHLNVFNDDHLVVIDIKKRAAQHLLGILVVSLGKKLERLGVALRRLQQAFALSVFAHAHQHLAHELLKRCAGKGRDFDCRFHKSALSIWHLAPSTWSLGLSIWLRSSPVTRFA